MTIGITPSPEAWRPRKKAVLVGVKDTKGCQLSSNMGAHKDTRLMKNLLLSHGYRLEDIRILIDRERNSLEDQPTRENILSAMKTLVNNAVPGDHLVFHFSGHGEQLATGDIHEIDGHDEIILPMDAGELDNPRDGAPQWSNYIVDDEFRAIFRRLPHGLRCVLVFDCCNSGTAADLPDVTDEIDIVHKHHGPLGQPNWKDEPQGPEPVLNGPSLTSWSACRDGDQAPGNNAGGIMVRAFCNVLGRVDPEDSNSYLTYGQLRDRIRDEMEAIKHSYDDKPAIAASLKSFHPDPRVGSLEGEGVLDQVFIL